MMPWLVESQTLCAEPFSQLKRPVGEDQLPAASRQGPGLGLDISEKGCNNVAKFSIVPGNGFCYVLS